MAIEIESIIQSSIRQGAMPLFYDDSFDKSLSLIRAMYQSGMQVIEYINRGPAAYENFRRLKLETRDEMPDLILGAGTIRTTEDAHRFIGIGADFLVSPCFDPWVASLAADLKVLWIPGCFTPTEIHTAWKQGIRLIKIFPALRL
jgi:2-dehydro-3-deoxyphosphogluconate aldolase/(4S)-4-hydroxy-2-oxoglutarate aldolase